MESASPIFACGFVPRKCTHEQLFHDSYLRTNRTNHTKIMRCFPHCCPGHRKRSYCGSPLYVQLDQNYVGIVQPQIATEELVVFARFRPLTASVPPLRFGARILLSTIRASLQSEDPARGEWVEGELSHMTTAHQGATVSWVFEVNASARWYYPWSGAATIALRAMEHVFEVLVFRRVEGELMEVLTGVASSKFRLMSFRRAVTNSDSETKSDVSTESTPRRTSPVVRSLPETKPIVRKRARVDKTTSTKQTRLSPAAGSCLSRAPSPTNSPNVLLPTTSTTLESAPSILNALVHWLAELPIDSAGSRRLGEWEQVVIDSCAGHSSHVQASERPVRRQLVSILSALRVSSSVSASALQSPWSQASPLDVIDATIRTLLHVLVDPECASHLASMVRRHPFFWGSSSEQLKTTYATWSHEFERHASSFCNTHTNASWTDLAAAAHKFQQQQRRSSHADTSFVYTWFVAQRREWYAQQQHRQAASSRAVRQEPRIRGVPISSFVSSSKPLFTHDPRVWVCRTTDVAMEMGSMTSHSFSLLTALHFWRNLSCIRMEYTEKTTSGRAAQFCATSVANVSISEECFPRFILDGTYRWFRCLPSGDATTGTTLMGYIVGDYVGRSTSAGTIHVTTYLWPLCETSAGVASAYAWHWTIDGSSLTQGSSTIVSVIIETAPLKQFDTSCSFDTMSIYEKLRCAGPWSHASHVQLTYRAQ